MNQRLLIPAAFILLLILHTAATAQNVPSAQQPSVPTLTIFVLPDKSDIPEKGRVEGDIYMHRIFYYFNCPLLPVVFFDRQSADLPKRYDRCTSPEEAATFSETDIPGGTLQQYYRLLDIMGQRLQRFPDATIQLIGHTSAEEPGRFARQRAETVRQYWQKTWHIDTGRVSITNAPVKKAAQAITEAGDLRRVDIHSDNWELVRPITQIDSLLYPSEDVVSLTLHNNVEQQAIESRWLIVVCDSIRTYSLATLGAVDIGTLDTTFLWNLYDVYERYVPVKSLDLQLITRLKDGRTLASTPAHIDVHLWSTEEIAYGCGHSLIRQSLLTYRPYEVENSMDDNIISDYLLPYLTDSSRIEILGHTGERHTDVLNRNISLARANRVMEIVREKGPATIQIEVRGVGEEDPLYTNELPEGRWFNETVNIIVVDPVRSRER